MSGTGSSNYISEVDRLKARPAKSLLPFFAALFTVFSLLGVIAFSGLSTNATSSSATVRADDQGKFEDAAGKYGASSGEDGLGKTMDKYNKDDAEKITPDDGTYTFAHVIQRIFTTRYINHAEDKAGDHGKAKRWNCNVDDPGAGTPLYHNCDVPNMLAQAVQGFIQGASPMGFVGATVASAKSETEMGVPSNLPGGTVPVNYGSGGPKYTALETLGYNLHYTSYKGEWDNISVTTSARMMANYGLMNVISLGVNAAINGAINGAKLGASRALNQLSQGNVIGAFGAFFTGWWEGDLSGILRTVLDSSDANVFRTHGWYRTTYGGTLYGARELTQEELSQRMNLAFQMMINGQKPDSAKVPQDYTAIKAGPPKPKKAISKCTDDKGKQVGKAGISEADCKKTKNAKYSADGTQKAQTLEEWKTAAAPILETAKKYSLTCDVPSSLDKLDSDFYSCWDTNWPKHQGDATAESQSDTNDDWQKKVMDQKNINDFLEKNPQYNINTPYVRFVCLDSSGNTMYKKDGWDYVFVYTKDGKVNPECGHAIRPPIQNGFFGNGYVMHKVKSKETQPNQNWQPDTRYSLVAKSSMLSFIMDTTSISNTVANGALSISSVETRVANTVLDLSFSPIVQKIGLDKLIEDYISAFRDGVYFPLVMIVLAFSSVIVLFNAGRNKDYFSGLKSAMLMIFTVFLSIMALSKPDMLIKVVDSGPAEVETFVAGAIFDVGDTSGDNAICSATSSSTKANDLAKSFAPSDAVRTMECQVWRAFYYNPYVYGQWGTSSNNLNAAGSGAPITVQNTNGALVGDASVAMGGGKTIKNWALYQARVLTSGTITTDDPLGSTKANGGKTLTTTSLNTIPTDLYRVVDMQAGPNNGSGTDGRYFTAWAGQNPLQRVLFSFVNILTAGLGMVAVVLYAFSKIEITIFSVMMMMFLPLALLLGVHPTFGRMKLKQYLGTIVSLMIQRVSMVALIAVMITIMSNLAMASTEALSNTIITMGVCLAFIFFRKKLLSVIGASTTESFGGSMLGNKTPREAFMQALPQSLQNSISQRAARNKGMVSGAAGGFLANGPKGIVKGAREAGVMAQSRETNSLRRMGQLGAVTKFNEAKNAGKEAAFKENKRKAKQLQAEARGEEPLDKDGKSAIKQPTVGGLNPFVRNRTVSEEERIRGGEVHSMVYAEINAKNAKNKKEQMRAQGMTEEEIGKVKIDKVNIDLSDPVVTQNLIKANEMIQKLHLIQEQRRGAIPGMPKKKPHPGDIEGMRKAAEAMRKHNRRLDGQEEKAKAEYEKAVDNIYYKTQDTDPRLKKHSKAYRQQELEAMRRDLHDAARILGIQGKNYETRAQRTNRKMEEKYYGDSRYSDFEGDN